jgi:hypothetical protein
MPCWTNAVGAALLIHTTVSAQQWSAQRVLLVGENEGLTLARVAGIAAAGDGRLFVLDAPESKVYVLSASGRIERSFGKRGAGPGELSASASEIMIAGNQIIIVDPLNQRINLLGSDGVFAHSRPLNVLRGPPVSWVVNDGRVISLIRPLNAALAARAGGVTQHMIVSVDAGGDAAADTLLRIDMPHDNEMSLGQTLRMKLNLRVPQLMLAGDGRRLLLATSDTYRIRVLDGAGRTTGWIGRPIGRRRYTTEELERLKRATDSTMTAALKAGMAAGARISGRTGQMPKPEIEVVYPEFAPAVVGVLANARWVLVQRSGGKAKPSEWDVLDWDGKFVGALRLPANFAAFTLWNDRVIGIEIDELDVESIAAYRISAPR